MNTFPKFELGRLLRFGTLTIIDVFGEDAVWRGGAGDPVHVRLNTKATDWALALNRALSLGDRYITERDLRMTLSGKRTVTAIV